MANSYSPQWFSLFMDAIPPEQTAREVAFLRHVLPLPTYCRLLDVCCGTGRHAHALGADGYEVVGIDANEAAIARARSVAPASCAFVCRDVRELHSMGGQFDAAVILWQSFGYFDAVQNAQLLRDLHARLRPGGRLVLDVYNRAFFATRTGTRTLDIGSRRVTETKAMSDDRLHITLEYEDARPDHFDWEIFTAEQLVSLAHTCGFEARLSCSGFEAQQSVRDDVPRMQLLFEAITRRPSG